jgi:O-methyltransferase involved in polyketide biosynthesis
VKDNIFYFDKIIKDFLWRFPCGTIVNMGNIIANTYEEAERPGITWYELDLPEEFGPKNMLCDDGRILIRSTILDDDWFDRIGYQERILFVAEGIFSCCAEKNVRALISRMCSHFPSFELLFNGISPTGMKTWNYVIQKSGGSGPPIKWGITGSGQVLRWNTRFRLLGNYRVYRMDSFHLNSPGRMNYLLLKIFGSWRLFHIRVRYNYKHLRN